MAEQKDTTPAQAPAPSKAVSSSELIKTVESTLKNAEPGKFGSDRKLIYKAEDRGGKVIITYRTISEAHYGNELLKEKGLNTKEVRLHEYMVSK